MRLTPLVASVAARVTVGQVTYQPLWPIWPLGVAVDAGATVSSLAEAVRMGLSQPAASCDWHEITLLPSAVSVTVAPVTATEVHGFVIWPPVAMVYCRSETPLPPAGSEAPSANWGSDTYQPLRPLGCVVRATVHEGGSLSSLNVAVAVVETRPARSCE